MVSYPTSNGTDLEDYGSDNDNISDPYRFPTPFSEQIKRIVPLVLKGNWENISLPVNEWQKSQLENLEEPGVRCLLNMWFLNQTDVADDAYCNATWDNVYCWPQTPSGIIVSRPCSEILKETEPAIAHHIQGKAVRICMDNGTWLWDKWTNYTQCADSYDEYTRNVEEERNLVVVVQYVLFIGSILSIICLSMALLIFYYFKCLRCDRVTVHIHLMAALFLRSALLIVITEPFIFNRSSHYRHVDLICKAVLSINLYATVASINWMFIQGLYLHGKLTTNVFDKGTPFRVYYLIGWILPLGLIIVYATVLETYHPVQCWKDYSERSDMWILLGPMIFALLANLLFLINIMRILLTKVQRPSSVSDSVQLRRAVKATFVLFPLLGINNLLFLYNPGGEYHKFFVVFNAIFGSTQGIFVSILYCFVNKDVRDAIRRLLRRYTARRSANSSRMTHSRGSSLVRQPVSRQIIHSRIKSHRNQQESEQLSRGRMSGTNSTPELVMIHQVRPNLSSPSSSFSSRYGNGSLRSPLPYANTEVRASNNGHSASVALTEL